MKAVSKLVVLLNLGALVGAAAYASDVEQAYLKSCNKEPGVPVPVVVVSPTVGPEFNGGLVELEFTVDQSGSPTAFSVKSASDDMLAVEVLKAVKLWRFLPAEVDGKPVARKVSLPVKIVDDAVAGYRYASVK
ncbi:MAG: TonB family protein [Opitutaceae bacterium]